MTCTPAGGSAGGLWATGPAPPAWQPRPPPEARAAFVSLPVLPAEEGGGRRGPRRCGPARSGRAGGTASVAQLPAVSCQGHRSLRPLPRRFLMHRRSLLALRRRLTEGQLVCLFRGHLGSGVHRVRNSTAPNVLPARSESCLGGWLCAPGSCDWR